MHEDDRKGFFDKLFRKEKYNDDDLVEPVDFFEDDYFDEDEDDVRPSKKKSNRKYVRNNPFKYLLIGAVVLCFISVTSFLVIFSIKHEIFSKGKVGVQAVKALYQFNTIDELESKLPKLQSITTDEIYNRIAVTNSDKALNVYLKFKKNPVKVEIIESKPGYVLYTLDSSSLSSGRLFMFSYTLNWKGEIDSVREMECIDFYKNQ